MAVRWFGGDASLAPPPPPPEKPQPLRDDTPKFTSFHSSYVGGDGEDSVVALAHTKHAGAVWLGGHTASSTGVGVSAAGAAARARPAGMEDGFVALLTTAGSIGTLRYYGGDADDRVTALAPDGDGGVLVAGYTESDTWSTVRLAGHVAGRRDAFILHQTSRGAVSGALRIGGGDDDEARAIALRNGVLWVVGNTESVDLPTTKGAPRASRGGGGRDGFIVALKFSAV